jgi:hypothetical protein
LSGPTSMTTGPNTKDTSVVPSGRKANYTNSQKTRAFGWVVSVLISVLLILKGNYGSFADLFVNSCLAMIGLVGGFCGFGLAKDYLREEEVAQAKRHGPLAIERVIARHRAEPEQYLEQLRRYRRSGNPAQLVARGRATQRFNSDTALAVILKSSISLAKSSGVNVRI